ncbi:Hypothetical_protein [Hexamita inflata]|uniref:Hypothetical_protein n=2 Tax=Hexamita inflata TaxID=28002 RepID=A0AA86R896_9EUKA|nr:Hypothetical protein HINF_LOCUS55717 [Hexamita inflata]
MSTQLRRSLHLGQNPLLLSKQHLDQNKNVPSLNIEDILVNNYKMHKSASKIRSSSVSEIKTYYQHQLPEIPNFRRKQINPEELLKSQPAPTVRKATVRFIREEPEPVEPDDRHNEIKQLKLLRILRAEHLKPALTEMNDLGWRVRFEKAIKDENQKPMTQPVSYIDYLTQQKKRLANDALLGFISGQFDIFKSVDNACLEIEQNMQILAEFIEIQAKFYNPQALHAGRIYMLEQVFQKLLRLTDSEKEFELNLQKFMEIRANTKLYYIPESKNKRIQQEVEYVKMVFDECDDNIRFLVDFGEIWKKRGKNIGSIIDQAVQVEEDLKEAVSGLQRMSDLVVMHCKCTMERDKLMELLKEKVN